MSGLKRVIGALAALAAVAMTGCAGHGSDDAATTGAGSALSAPTVNRVHCMADFYSVDDIPAQFLPAGEDVMGTIPSGRIEEIHTSQFSALLQTGDTTFGVAIAVGPKIVVNAFYPLEPSLDVELFFQDMAPFTKDGKTYDAARVSCKAEP